MLNSEFALNNLSNEQKNIVSGIFPSMPIKGFHITKDGFLAPQKYQGF